MRLVVGFMPLLDCATPVIAAELGFAAQEGLDLRLVRETSWANIRDRIIVGHFDAAHMLAPMTLAATLGIGHVKTPVIAPFSLGLGGNAITVSLPLWEQMQSEGATEGAPPTSQGTALRRAIDTREGSRSTPLTFGVVYPFSCHNYQLRHWLTASGIDPDKDVRLTVIPPPFLADALRTGQIDGFCAGEPWSSVAVDAGVGVIVTPTTSLWPTGPEKVLGCRTEWASRYPEALAALLRALYRAAHWIESPDNHTAVARLLAEPRYVGTSSGLLHRALAGRLALSPGAEPRTLENFFVPASHHATFPWVSHALWLYTQMVQWQQTEHSPENLTAVRHTYRPDLYRAALAGVASDIPSNDLKPERFFDGSSFDPGQLHEV